MTTRIGGDFNQDAVEAFRDAYAQILNSPDDDTVANESGLLTDTVANTSPWHNHLPLWKYPSGKGPDEDLKRSFDPNDFISQQNEEEEEVDDSPMTDEEVETLIDELLNSTDEEDEEIEE